MIELYSLTKSYKGSFILNDLTFKFEPGKIYQIQGKNGSGKTTLFKIILGLVKADSGKMIINEKEVQIHRTSLDGIGFYLESEHLIDFLKPKEYFKLIGGSKPYIEDHIPFLEILNEEKLIRDLSKGNQSKVGILSASYLANSLLILDEPFSYLDHESKLKLLDTIINMNEKRKVTILFSSHESLVLKSSNLIELSLHDGKLKEVI